MKEILGIVGTIHNFGIYQAIEKLRIVKELPDNWALLVEAQKSIDNHQMTDKEFWFLRQNWE